MDLIYVETTVIGNIAGRIKRIRMLRHANGQQEIGGNPLRPNTNSRYRNL